MNICLITEYFYPDNAGSTPTLLSELARHMVDNHSDVSLDVITSRNLYRMPGGKQPSREDWDGIRIFRVNTPRSNRPSVVQRLAAGALFSFAALLRLLRLGKYDLVFVGTNPPFGLIAAMAARTLKKIPYVYLIHDLYPDLPIVMDMLKKDGLLARLARNIQTEWLRGATTIIVQGRCTADHLKRVYGVPSEIVQVISHWADPGQVRPLSAGGNCRRQYGFNGFVALYAGNLGPFQGLDVIIEAATLLRSVRHDITFALVGNGTRRDELSERIASQSLANVKLFPPVPPRDYLDLLAAADVLLVPLAAGICGLSVPSKFYTMLAAGRPIVAVMDANAEISRVVMESGCGVHVDHGNAQQLADAIVMLASSEDLVCRMSIAARQVLEDNYTFPIIAEQYYRTLIAAGSSTATATEAH